MARKIYWVRRVDAKWKVRTGDHTLSVHDRKEDAVRSAVAVASNNAPSSLKICRQDGTIEDERTYGNDPFPPRG
jgi:hypothetical protein